MFIGTGATFPSIFVGPGFNKTVDANQQHLNYPALGFCQLGLLQLR